jgi:hypothetical protein
MRRSAGTVGMGFELGGTHLRGVRALSGRCRDCTGSKRLCSSGRHSHLPQSVSGERRDATENFGITRFGSSRLLVFATSRIGRFELLMCRSLTLGNSVDRQSDSGWRSGVTKEAANIPGEKRLVLESLNGSDKSVIPSGATVSFFELGDPASAQERGRIPLVWRICI